MAIAQASGAKSPLVGAVEESGQGVRGAIDGAEVKLGRPSFCGAEQLAEASAMADPEASIMASSPGQDKYLFSVRQGLRPDARAVISALKQRDVALEILSGDREPAVRAAARVLDISEWRAGVTPADKISLAAAHVSMSPIGAAHLSQSTADLVFLGKPLAPVVAAIDFSREALHLMRQNLWLAVGYNLLAVPIAISGVVTPLIAAAAMSGSSILVMLNAVAP